MTSDKTALIEQLLKRTSHAHGEYESTVLKGVYDEAWASWYAQWAVEHGLNDLVAQPMDAERWSAVLHDLNERHKLTDRHQPWAEFTAQEIATMFK